MAVGREINGETVSGIWASSGWDPAQSLAQVSFLGWQYETYGSCT